MTYSTRGGQILLVDFDFDFEINFPKPCYHAEFFYACKSAKAIELDL